MGTLGCINDMLQRDKENRELRKLNRDRMKEHHKYLVGKGKNADLSNVSIEKIEEIRKKFSYLQPIVTQYLVCNKSEIWP